LRERLRSISQSIHNAGAARNVALGMTMPTAIGQSELGTIPDYFF
jgi:hypothetical protein